MESRLRTRIVTMPIRIGVRLAKVGPPPPPPSARAAPAAAAASEEAPARCSRVRRVMSEFIAGLMAGVRMALQWTSLGFSERVINPALELPIGDKRRFVDEGQDLRHDDARDPRRRVDPVIGVEQPGPSQAAGPAAIGHRAGIDHVAEPPAQPDAWKQIH